MCGIYLSCSITKRKWPSQELKEKLQRRGPDHFEVLTRDLTESADSSLPRYFLTAASSVLWIRGEHLTVQPVRDCSPSTGSFLLWNGEAWEFDGRNVVGGDTRGVFSKLTDAIKAIQASSSKSIGEVISAFVLTLRRISGPYAFVFYDHYQQQILFGRDPLGRRSLLIRLLDEGCLEISSVSGGPKTEPPWSEVDANGVHRLDLTSAMTVPGEGTESFTPFPGSLKRQVIPWTLEGLSGVDHPTLVAPFFPPVSKEVGQLSDVMIDRAVREARSFLAAALQHRISPIPQCCGLYSGKSIAILFSGGLDSSLVAAITASTLTKGVPIDLLNVAFENPRQARLRRLESAFDGCPDRSSALEGFDELRRLYAHHTWQFTPIDVPYIVLKAHEARIKQLMHPHATEMDFSIACALYFASRGRCAAEDEPQLGSSSIPSRVLLSGLGADELFGGYRRHAAAVGRDGYAGLAGELQLDFRRLGSRNLGRDDRMISDWAKEVRYPFLDERLVTWALTLPLSLKFRAGPDENRLGPDKWILRLLAADIGLAAAARRPKRAMQFGTRSAKLLSGKSKGTDPMSQ